MALYEIHRRVANTEAGKQQLNYEKSIAMMDAFGAMYRSSVRGMEFNRTAVAVRCELQYNVLEYEEDED